MNKLQLLQFLDEIGASPRKSLSQNFLIDSNIIHKLISLAAITEQDRVLEIGSGPGAITAELLQAGAHVLAVEKDRLFGEHLPPHPHLQVHCGDVLKFPFNTLEKGTAPWKVVSNLPFHITAPILERLCAHADVFESFTLIVQKEVVDRIKAKPRTKEYSSLTIFLQFYTRIDGYFPIPASCFYPKPAVDSTAIRLLPIKRPNVNAIRFFSLVHQAFQQRRKMLSSSLKTVSGHIPAYLEMIGHSPMARPEELTIEDWIQLIEKIDSTPN